MRSLRIAILLTAAVAAAPAAAQGSGGSNAADRLDTPTLVLVSLDGFRWDWMLRQATPALDRIAQNGVRADAMIPVYPTLTFPNHYSIATGLYPARHGLVGNRFYSRDRERFYSLRDRRAVEDGAWYEGEPIWVAAERAGLVSAAYFFVGTEAAIDGISPTYWHPFNASIAGNRRVDQVIEWLGMPDETRPRMITLYFEDVDETAHDTGVDSPQTGDAVRRVDGYLERLLTGIDELGIADELYLIVVSDHGLSRYRGVETFVIAKHVDLEGIRAVDHGPVTFLYLDEPDLSRARAIADRINERWRYGQAVIPGEAPSGWQVLRGSRFADVIVQADPRASVVSVERSDRLSYGDHGWPPDFRDMHGIFLAMGPRLPRGQRIPAVNAVDVYPLMRAILELPPAGDIDGNAERLVPLLSTAE